MSKETSALCAATTQHGAAAFQRVRYLSMDIWTSKAEWDRLCNSFFFFSSAVMVFHNLNCQKQSGHAVVSFNSVLLYNRMTHCTAVRDLGNQSLSWALTPSFLSQGERSDTGRQSSWILKFHGPMLLWAVWGLELCRLEKACTGATSAWGSPGKMNDKASKIITVSALL